MDASVVLFMVAMLASSANAPVASLCAPVELLPPASEMEAVADSQVRLTLIEPANDGAVNADSVVVVDVDYAVAGFQPGQFGLMMSFPALVSSISPHGPEGYYDLPQAKGRVRLCVPLRPVYESPRLRWPLKISVNPNKRISTESSRFSAVFEQVAASGHVDLNSRSPAAESRQLLDAAVDAEFRDAVFALAGTIAGLQATGQACPQFADLQVEFSAAYLGWVSRNGPLIEQVQDLQRDLFVRDMERMDIVDEVMKRQSAVAAQWLDDLPVDQLRAHCQRHSRAFSNPRSDLETAGAAQLAIIRARPPAPLPAMR